MDFDVRCKAPSCLSPVLLSSTRQTPGQSALLQSRIQCLLYSTRLVHANAPLCPLRPWPWCLQQIGNFIGPQVMNLAAFVLYSPRAYNIARTKKSNKANITRRVYPHRSVCLSMLTFRFIPPFQMQFIVGHMQGLSPCRRACALTSIYNNSLGTRHDIRGFTQSYRKCTHWATDNCNCYGDVTEATPPK